SVRQLASTSGTVLDTLTYDSFGATVSESNPGNGDRFNFTSREWDGEIALQFNRTRYYMPSDGRWLSEDPAGFKAGESNLYRYVGNHPISSWDPNGLQPQQLPLGSPVLDGPIPPSQSMTGTLAMGTLHPVALGVTGPAAAAVNARISRTIKSLGADQYATRKKAQEQLDKLRVQLAGAVDRAVIGALKDERKKNKPDIEVARRLETYLNKHVNEIEISIGWYWYRPGLVPP